MPRVGCMGIVSVQPPELLNIVFPALLRSIEFAVFAKSSGMTLLPVSKSIGSRAETSATEFDKIFVIHQRSGKTKLVS